LAVSSPALRVLAAVVAAVVLGVAAAWWMSAARLPPDVLGGAETSDRGQRPTPEASTPASATPEASESSSEPSSAGTLPPACAALPLARRAALVLVVGMPEVTGPDDPLVGELTKLGVGGVFLAGYNVHSAAQVRALVDELRSGVRPRPLIATDEEWGRVSSFRDVFGPTSSPRTLAASQPPRQVRAAAKDLAGSLADLGIDWNFAPVADLDDGPADGVIGDRAFAAAPGAAGDYAEAFARGLEAGGVLPTVKHFPGHGAVPGDIDPHSKTVRSDATLSQLRNRHLPPFEKLIAGDVPVVMLNHVTYVALDDVPASMSPHAYRMLRDLGFDGVAITDSIGMGAVHRRWDFPQATVRAIRAGADAVLATDGRHARDMRDQLVDAVRAGRLDEQRLNEAAARMLALHRDRSPCS
jgi:beta-N-acetylhexosaminidase